MRRSTVERIEDAAVAFLKVGMFCIKSILLFPLVALAGMGVIAFYGVFFSWIGGA